MAKTLLNAVNEILKRAGVIAGADGEFSSLSSTARQRDIDVAVQVVNEGLDELYRLVETPRPNVQKETSLTLVASTRAYTLATDLVRMRWPLIDKTNTQFLHEYAAGYNALLQLDPEQDDTGLPHFCAISPVDGSLHMDRAPTSIEAGRVYTYQYDKDTTMDEATDEVPFKDIVFRAMVPVWANLWKRDRRGKDEFDAGLFALHLGRAAGALNQKPHKSSYNPRAA